MLDSTDEQRNSLTSYDADRQADIDAELAEYDRVQQWRASFTPEKLRELGYTESKEYPGYFENDPRYPQYSVEDRYLMDHPGLDWKTKPSLANAPRVLKQKLGSDPSQQWDDEQFSGQPLEAWTPPERPRPVIVPVRSGEAEKILQNRVGRIGDTESLGGKASARLSGLWVCRICRKNFALWPSERALRLSLFGLNLTLVFRSPIACTQCRVMEQATVRQLGNEGARPFWTAAIQVWEGEALPTAGIRVRRLLRARAALLGAPASLLRGMRRRS
jgi:hypothetical protein